MRGWFGFALIWTFKLSQVDWTGGRFLMNSRQHVNFPWWGWKGYNFSKLRNVTLNFDVVGFKIFILFSRKPALRGKWQRQSDEKLVHVTDFISRDRFITLNQHCRQHLVSKNQGIFSLSETRLRWKSIGISFLRLHRPLLSNHPHHLLKFENYRCGNHVTATWLIDWWSGDIYFVNYARKQGKKKVAGKGT